MNPNYYEYVCKCGTKNTICLGVHIVYFYCPCGLMRFNDREFTTTETGAIKEK